MSRLQNRRPIIRREIFIISTIFLVLTLTLSGCIYSPWDDPFADPQPKKGDDMIAPNDPGQPLDQGN